MGGAIIGDLAAWTFKSCQAYPGGADKPNGGVLTTVKNIFNYR